MNRFQRRQEKRGAERDERQSLSVQLFNELEEKRMEEATHSATYRNPIISERRFYSTFRVPGFRQWFKISAHPVLLNYHTQIGTSQTARVMNLLF